MGQSIMKMSIKISRDEAAKIIAEDFRTRLANAIEDNEIVIVTLPTGYTGDVSIDVEEAPAPKPEPVAAETPAESEAKE
jgi:hypothetical protein